MKKIGLTGGIGSGKSYIAELFHAFGIPVFHADIIAKESYSDPKIRAEVIRILGKESYQSLMPDFRKISTMVFSDSELLNQINSLIHPWVLNRFQEWSDKLTAFPYVLKEAAILFESGSNKNLDGVICVHAPEDLRIKRVTERDNSTETLVRTRISKQWPQERIIELSDYLINNDGTNLVLPQVLKIHNSLTA